MALGALRLAFALAVALGAAGAGADTFVYVHDYGEANQVHSFVLGRQGLEALPGSPFVGPDGPTGVADQCNGYCQTMAWLREEELLLTSGPGGLTPWHADSGGALSPVRGASCTRSRGPASCRPSAADAGS